MADAPRDGFGAAEFAGKYTVYAANISHIYRLEHYKKCTEVPWTFVAHVMRYLTAKYGQDDGHLKE